MKTQLYKYDGTPLFEVLVDASSSQSWSLMSDNKLSLSFELEECVVLTAGCYIEFDNTRFYLLTEYKPTMVCRSAWKYDLTLGDAASWLSITLALKTTDGENAPLFKYTGPAVEHAAIIVANLNRLMGTDKWKVGSVISTENITIDYSGKYCSEVLQEIVDTKNTEWWIDDMTLNIGRAEFGDPIELGYQNGLLGDIIREQSDNSKSYRYLYPVGSTRNIDPTKYGYDRLQLPDGRTYIDMNVEQGIAELFEEAAFAHIFPRYEGTVQTVRTQIANGNSGPFVIYYFSDSNIPFNPNDYEIAGLKKQISFLSGELMGEDFEVNYNPSSKEFEIITKYPESSNNIQLPGGLLIPNIGDKYVIWNITMPAEYYSLASQELLEAAEAFAQKYIYDGGIYHASLDYIDVQLRSLRLRPGQRVRLQSPEYFPKTGHYDSRITRVTRSLWYPNEMNIDISSERSMGVIKKLSSDVKSAQTKSNTLSATLSTLNAAFVAHKMLFDEFFEKDSAGNIHAKLSLWSSGGITAGGVGSGGSGGGGISYNRLDSWSDYSADKAGYVLSALLGKDLDNRVSALANAGYITASALAPYALRSELPIITKDGLKSTLGISDWALASTKPTYTASEVGALSVNGGHIYGSLYITKSSKQVYIAYEGASESLGYIGFNGKNSPIYIPSEANVIYSLIHSGNYSDYALSVNGGTVKGETILQHSNSLILTIKRTGTGASLIRYNGDEGLRGGIGFGTDGVARIWDNTLSGNYPILTSDNFSQYALPLTGGIMAKNSYIDWGNTDGFEDYSAYSNGFKILGYNAGSGDYRGGIHVGVRYGWQLTRNAGSEVFQIRNYSPSSASWGDWKTIAFTSDIPTKLSQLTDDVVAGKYLSLAGGTVNGSITASSFIGNLVGVADKSKVLGDYYGERVASANLDFTDSAVRKIIATSSMTTAKPPADGSILHFAWDNAGGWNHQLFIASGGNTGPDKRMAWRAQHYGSWSEWESIAFIDSNVASATKLATARSIFGQSFDGTKSITGNEKSIGLDSVNAINGDANSWVDKYSLKLESSNNAMTFMVDNTENSRKAMIQVGHHATAYAGYLGNLYLNPLGGNVAIGGKTADEKFHVHGNGKFTGALTANSLTIGGVTLTYDSVNEALCVNGNMYALGGITAGGAGISAYTSLESRVARLEQQLNIS